MTVADLQNQASGIQSEISNWQSILNNPGASVSYRTHAQMQIDQLNDTLIGLQMQIAQATNDAALAAQAQAAIDAQLAAAAAYAAQQAALAAGNPPPSGSNPVTPTIQPTSPTPAPVPTVPGAVYTGQSTAQGGTWGNTAATLAAQQVAGGQIQYTVQDASSALRIASEAEAAKLTQQAVASLSDKQKEQYKATVAALESSAGATAQEKLASYQQQAAAQYAQSRSGQDNEALLAKVQAEAINKAQKEYGIEATKFVEGSATTAIPTLQTAKEPSVVQLKSGEFIEQTVYAKLEPKYQEVLMKDGIAALNDRLDKEEVTAKASQQEAIKDTKYQLANIESKQANYEAQSLWEKVAQTLNKPVTFSEAVQEALTFGGAETKALDSDKIDKEYNESRLKALEAGADIGISQQEYKDQVLAKQITAQELGMQLVPFEYAREGRFDQLQLWEKVVYPIADVASLIPVIGWFGKGVAVGSKGVSVGAKIAALGGKAAIEFAAKDAALGLEKAAAQKLAKEGLLMAVKEGAKSATDNVTKSILQKAIKPAMKDAELAAKEYGQIAKNADELAKLSGIAAKTETAGTKGAKVYKAASRVGEVIGKAGKYSEPIDITSSTGIVGYSTVSNWNDLTPEQRVAGLGLAALTSGIGGKAVNLAENLIDPYKIPIAALKPRAARTEAIEGKMFSSTKKDIAGTTRLVLDHTMKPEDARVTVASLMKQLTEGEKTAKATIKTTAGEREIKVKGTGLQEVVGKTSVSATPMGEIFKEGTGAAGAKTNLEKYLRDANLAHGSKIEITSKPVKIGETEMEVKTISAPGVSVQGAEGGMYLGAAFYNQFAHKAAFGASGKISAGLLVSTPGISELPKGIKNIKDIASMEKQAIKHFDGAKDINKEVEGFKQYAKFMEFENVITNGSQLQRTTNLRSKLADELHMNRGEYYTRDSKGRVELFQMYLEGGRATPYTMKELYALKGKALSNSLEDLFYGLERRIEDLKEGKLISPKENLITKEEQVSKAFNNIDETVARKGLTDAEAKRLKGEILNEYRSRIDAVPNRTVLREQIGRLATRTEPQRRAADAETRRYIENVRAERAADRQRIVGRADVRETARGRAEERAAIREAGRPVDREAAREVVRDTGREATREAPRAATREALRETPREIPREIPRETPRETPRSILREMPRETPRNVPREVPRQTPREVPRETPRSTPHITPRITTPITPRITKIITFIQEHSEHKKLDPKQFEGMLAWKQGFVYQIRWKPFGKTDVFYSREPIPEVKYFDGIGSAAKSAVALYGEIPKQVRVDMGIIDVNIFRGKDMDKPVLNFKADPKQKTHYTGIEKQSGSIKKSK
jgi:hypothetical protein